MPYDILAAFRDLAEGKRRASDVLRAGHAFCMGKASSFVALCRASGIPARVGFQQLHCPDKPFMSEEVRRLWGDRTLPWHSLGEAYLDGRWLRLDATIDAPTARAKGRPYTREFDGEHDIPSVEGPDPPRPREPRRLSERGRRVVRDDGARGHGDPEPHGGRTTGRGGRHALEGPGRAAARVAGWRPAADGTIAAPPRS